jgi:L-fuconolactonase
VQAANNKEDTDWMLDTASRSEWIKGVVGWLPLMDPKETNSLLSLIYLSNKYFKGVRHLIHDEPDPQWLLQDKVIDSLKILAAYGIPYDVVGVKPEHMETVLQVIKKVPDLRMVFDHLNQPPAATKDQNTSWHRLMEEAAAHKNLFAKISGLGTTTKKPGTWTAEDIQPAVAFVLESSAPTVVSVAATGPFRYWQAATNKHGRYTRKYWRSCSARKTGRKFIIKMPKPFTGYRIRLC